MTNKPKWTWKALEEYNLEEQLEWSRRSKLSLFDRENDMFSPTFTWLPVALLSYNQAW